MKKLKSTKLVTSHETAHQIKDSSECKQFYWSLKSVLLPPTYNASQAERLRRKYLFVSRKETSQFSLFSTNMYWASVICQISVCSLGPKQWKKQRFHPPEADILNANTLGLWTIIIPCHVLSPQKENKISLYTDHKMRNYTPSHS